MKKRLLSWLLVLTMVISLIPSTLVTALAADDTTVTTVTEGNTYYFDLSGVTIPGTVNNKLPDQTMHYVPFTYVGSVDTYVLKAASSGVASASADASQTTDPNATYGYTYDHSLFVADYTLTHSVHWHTYNSASLIFGKSYTGGGITYRLRAPSAGSSYTGSGISMQGIPTNNEWDAILDKNGELIKNWKEIHPLGQDTTTASYRVSRGIHSVRYWGNTQVSTPWASVGFRPVLELPSTDTLTTDGKAVTLKLNGCQLGNSSDDIQIVVKTGGTFKAPPAQGLTLPSGEITSNLSWLSDEGELYTPNADVPATVETLTAVFPMCELTYHKNTTDTVTGMPDPATTQVAGGAVTSQCPPA